MSQVRAADALTPKNPRVRTVHEIPHRSPQLSLPLVQRPEGLVRKRIFDLVFSLLVIVCLLSWLLPLLALCIRIDSRGPIFFRQKRVGANGRIFHCLKLRSMYVNREAHTQQAGINDPRITPLGRILRLSCMDELPQFFNVLAGHMSVVGPRPHMLKDCREFSDLIPHYEARYLVKPGITGVAQVKGYRGKTVGVHDIVHRYKWDMFYVRNCSFRLDMRIILLTIVTTTRAIMSHLTPSRKKEEPLSYELKSPECLN